MLIIVENILNLKGQLKDNSDLKLKECAEANYFWSVGNELTPPNTVSNNDTD